MKQYLMVFVLHLLVVAPATVYAEIYLSVTTNLRSNTFVDGIRPEIIVKHGLEAHGKVRYHWEGYRHELIGAIREFAAGNRTIVKLPRNIPVYAELVVTPVNSAITIAGRGPGEARYFGFAFFTEPAPVVASPSAASWMGIVHGQLDDPWVAGWLKSMTWRTTSAKWWGWEMDRRRERGYIELPIISGAEWNTQDTEQVSEGQLFRLRKRVEDYLLSDPETLYWETGIEENLRSRFTKPFYFSNLRKKSDIVRAVADSTRRNIQLIYQIANIRSGDIDTFLESKAAINYDIVSLHPYNWPDYPDVELWLDDFLMDAQARIKAHDRDMPIWISEIGAPHRGNSHGAFFGYPNTGKSVRGLTKDEMVVYLIKFHVVSHWRGVEKVFWYNYKDRGAQRDFAEDHFGLIDYWGYPKPAYVAYVALHQRLAHREVVSRLQQGNLWAYKYPGDAYTVIVAWSYPAASTAVSLDELGIASYEGVKIFDVLGKELPMEGTQLTLTHEPVYIHSYSK